MHLLEIITAKKAGFCFGVQRAIDMAVEATKNKENKSVFTLGSLIHNPQVVNKLKDRGITTVASIDEISEGILIIRSHGAAPEIIEKARNKGLEIIDTTCPYVKKAQNYVSKLVNEGYQTFIFGDRDHPEVKGIYGFSNKKAIIIKNKHDLDKINIQKQVGFVAQTTQSPEAYQDIISSIINKTDELKVYNTICNTTQVRQNAAELLAQKVDLMFVIGGYNSANTNRLAEICSETDTPTYHIETARDLKRQWLTGKNKIGITAGASTPDWLIKEVIQAMKEEDSTREEEKKESEGVENVNKEFEEKEEEMEMQTEELEEKNEQESAAEDADQKEDEKLEETSETAVSEESSSDEVEEVEEVEKVNEETADDKEEEENKEAADQIEETEEEVPEFSEDDTAEEAAEEDEETIEYSDIADLKKGQSVTGNIVEVQDDGIYVDVGYKSDGFIPSHELSNKSFDHPSEIVSDDEEIKVVILTLEDDEGNMILSKKQADYEQAWEDITESYENDEIIEAEVTKEVKGGLVVDVGVRGFIPASHVAIGYVEDLSEYVGQTLPLKIIEVERDNQNVVLSHKKVLEKERVQEKEETLKNLEEGQTITGTITNLVDFGAFVDLGGVEGLLHISEMSWGRIEHPSDLFEEGQQIEVKVLSVNKDEERISLGYKQLQSDPWEEFAEKHYEGEIVEGTITKIVDFGAFMEIEDGIEGLIHISQLSQKHVKTADEIVTVGETRDAKILNIDPEQKRVGLSLKEIEDQVKEDSSPKESSSSQKEESNQEEEKEESSGATIGELVGDIFDD